MVDSTLCTCCIVRCSVFLLFQNLTGIRCCVECVETKLADSTMGYTPARAARFVSLIHNLGNSMFKII